MSFRDLVDIYHRVVKDRIRSLGSRLAHLGIRPAQPVRGRCGDRAEGSIDILEECMQVSKIPNFAICSVLLERLARKSTHVNTG